MDITYEVITPFCSVSVGGSQVSVKLVVSIELMIMFDGFPVGAREGDSNKMKCHTYLIERLRVIVVNIIPK